MPPPPPLGEPKITISAEHHLKGAYEQEIGLKMLEIAILETQICKIFWGSMFPDHLESLCLQCWQLPTSETHRETGPVHPKQPQKAMLKC